MSIFSIRKLLIQNRTSHSQTATATTKAQSRKSATSSLVSASAVRDSVAPDAISACRDTTTIRTASPATAPERAARPSPAITPENATASTTLPENSAPSVLPAITITPNVYVSFLNIYRIAFIN